jgi:transcriptional regulator with XRE-family HTH domain
MDNLRTRFGHRLTQIRKQHGFTQDKLAEATNVSVDFISLIEMGQRAPSFDTLERLADALDLIIADLFTFDSKQ